jgi:phospholipase/lecithinase/hemolysin
MRVVQFGKTAAATTSTDPRLSISLVFRKISKSASIHTQIALLFASVILLPLSAIGLRAQDSDHVPDITSIVVLGDSLSDTGNVAHLTELKYGVRIPGPVGDYTDGRFTDGYDTLPPAQNYFGVWIEQLAASMPSKPEVKDSLDGGTDYAYGFATTGKGTGLFTFGPSNSLSVNVDNIGQQITNYLSKHPKISDKTLFVVWGGAIDVLYTTSSQAVIEAGVNQTLNIERLIKAGGTRFIVPNLPPLGLVPRLNGSPTTSIPATEASALYNTVLTDGLRLLREAYRHKHLHLSQLDVFALFNKIVAAPGKYSLANITASSQGAAVDPDSYLFWDDLHPTTRGHNILALTAAEILERSDCQHGFALALNGFENENSGWCGESAVGLVGAGH